MGGMAWLLCCPLDEVRSGEFYLDRSPQVQHIAGPFFTEGSYTKNSTEQIDDMTQKLESWVNGGIPRPDELKAISEAVSAGKVASKSKCVPLESKIDLQRFMG